MFCDYLNIVPIFLTVKLNIDLVDNINNYKDLGWMPEDCLVINMYDSLRGKYDKILSKKNLSSECYRVEEKNVLHQRYWSKKNSFNQYVVWRDVEHKKLNYINIFYRGFLIKREKYDVNGCLYLVQELNESRDVTTESLMGVNGNIILKKYFVEGKLEKIILYNKFGETIDIFDQEIDLISYWVRTLDLGENPKFIIDKNRFWAKALHELKKDISCNIVSMIHSNHMREIDYNNVVSGRLNSNYSAIFEKKYYIDNIIVLTQQQKHDITLRDAYHNLVVIPHSIDGLPKFIQFNQRNRNKIVTLCRLAPEKQVIDMVYMMKELVKVNSNVKLHIYGEGVERKKIEDKISELGLEKNIILEGFISDIAQAYQDAVCSLLTSKCEGFSLSILESLSFAVPAISYDVKYGPASMIKHDVNGYLVEQGNHKKIAHILSQILNDEEKLEELSYQAYLSAQNYLPENLASSWKKLLEI